MSGLRVIFRSLSLLLSFGWMTSVFRFLHLSASNGQLNVRLRVISRSRFVLLSASNGQLNVRPI